MTSLSPSVSSSSEKDIESSLQQNISKPVSEKEFNANIGLLKIIAIYSVIYLHIYYFIDKTGKLNITQTDSLASFNWYFSWFTLSMANAGVNIFAIVSGYVMLESKFKFSRIINLTIQTQFVSLVSILIEKYFVGSGEYMDAIFPLFTNRYWYYSSYLGLYFITPFLNKAIINIDKIMAYQLIVVIVCIFSFIPFISAILGYGIDIFNLNHGFSTLWLIILYIIGACIKKYNLYIRQYSNLLNLVGYISMALIAVILRFIINHTSYTILNQHPTWSNTCFTYTSPTSLLTAVYIIMFCLRLKDIAILSFNCQKIVRFISTYSYGIYIIHMSFLWLWQKQFSDYIVVELNNKWYFIIYTLRCLIVAIAIFTESLLIDYLRDLLFRFVKINKLLKIIDNKMKELL